MKYAPLFCCLPFAALLSAGCSERAAFQSSPGEYVQMEAVEVVKPEAEMIGARDMAPAPPAALPSGYTYAGAADLKIIRTAQLRLRVDDYQKRRLGIDQIVQDAGAYIAAEREYHHPARTETQLTIRVPADAFTPLLTALLNQAAAVEQKEISATDVTEQFVDMQARLRAKKEVEQRFLQILNQANTVEDVLNVESQLRGIREDIESMEGRLRHLTSSVDFSTIHLTLYAPLADGVVAGPPGFWSRAAEALRSGWSGVLALLLALLHVWPLWVACALLAYAGRRWWQRRALQHI